MCILMSLFIGEPEQYRSQGPTSLPKGSLKSFCCCIHLVACYLLKGEAAVCLDLHQSQKFPIEAESWQKQTRKQLKKLRRQLLRQNPLLCHWSKWSGPPATPWSYTRLKKLIQVFFFSVYIQLKWIMLEEWFGKFKFKFLLRLFVLNGNSIIAVYTVFSIYSWK